MHDIRGLTRGINGITGARLRRPITAALLAIGLVTALSASAVARTAASASSQPAYLNASVPVPARVSDLLGRMTLPEKIGQMVQIEQSNVTDTTSACTSQGGFNLPNPTCEQKIFVDDNVGSILAGGTDIPIDTTGKGGPGNTGLDWATEYNTMQSYAIKHSRLHIPVIFGVDAVHGFGHPWQAPLFPQSIGMGATWDPSAAQAGGEVTANALRATGWNWDFAPVQDIARDNRWGRYYETWAEEPALAAAMGAANVRGLQSGGAGGLKVTATVKHFAGYSESINGHDRVQAELPLRYLQDTFMPSYAGAINAGAGTVMVDSGSVNGIPATASHYLLTTQLRDRMGFKGVVISDYGDVGALATTYHMAAGLAGAAALAINAGVDMAMLPFNADQWQTAVQADVADHSISVSRINQAVSRILTLKFQLGLFDHPTVERQQGKRRGGVGPFCNAEGGSGVDDPAAQPEQRAAAAGVQQTGRHRAERRLDDQPARRLERQLAGCLRRRPRLLHGARQPDPAGHHGAQGPAGRGPERDLRDRPGHGGERRQISGRRRGRGGREGLRRGSG